MSVYKSDWHNIEKLASHILLIETELRIDRKITLTFNHHSLVDISAKNLLYLHSGYDGSDIFKSYEVIEAIQESNLTNVTVDFGHIATRAIIGIQTIDEAMEMLLADITPRKDVVLFGFGRIGRLVARDLLKKTGNSPLQIKAVVVRDASPQSIQKRADLLRDDSVHGLFKGVIEVSEKEKAVYVNGYKIQFIESSENIDYTKYGINNALLIDNTGIYRTKEELSKHLAYNGIDRVLLTAPAKDDIPNIVVGVNHQSNDFRGEIYSAASCTTNAIAPALYLLETEYSIKYGHIETIHSYTNDQNLLDNYHKKNRRGRAAAINMVLTETGAANAVVKVVPSLENKLSANAVRVPTPNGSLAILNLELGKQVTVEEVNELFRHNSITGPVAEQITWSNSNELVSSDVITHPGTCIVDSPNTIVNPHKNNLILYVWYDNEYGYTQQVVRLSKLIARGC